MLCLCGDEQSFDRVLRRLGRVLDLERGSRFGLRASIFRRRYELDRKGGKSGLVRRGKSVEVLRLSSTDVQTDIVRRVFA